jgi:four helix bundle protein
VIDREENTMVKSYKDLLVWQRSMELCVEVYRMTSTFPDSEKFGLTNQLRRATVSVASNIAEGYGRASTGEYIQFLGHSRGSIYEVNTQLLISQKLNFGATNIRENAIKTADEVGKMLVAMMKKLRE